MMQPFLWYNVIVQKQNPQEYYTAYQLKLQVEIEKIIEISDPVYSFFLPACLLYAFFGSFFFFVASESPSFHSMVARAWVLSYFTVPRFIQLYSGSGLYLGSRREHVVSRKLSRELAESLGYLAQGQREVAEFGFRRFREKLGHSAADGVHSQD